MASTDDQQILGLLQPWNKRLLRETEIPFNEATRSMLTDYPIVEAKRVSPQLSSRWTLNLIDTNKVATLTYTGLWSWGSNMETGNFVPAGQVAPFGVSEDRIQTTPSYRCDISFAFDTSVDDTLWNNMHEIDLYMESLQDFNKGNKPRRTWQDGKDPTLKQKYTVSSRLFVRPTPQDNRSSLSREIHPWIAGAANRDWVPNPDIPRCYELCGREVVRLETTNEPYFRKNDIVRMTFVIHIVVGLEHWHPEIVPLELMRVGTFTPADTLPKQPTSFPAIGSNFKHLEPGKEVSFFEAPVRENKRKIVDSDEEREETIRTSKRRGKVSPVDTDAMDEDIPEPPPFKPKIRISLKGKEREHKLK